MSDFKKNKNKNWYTPVRFSHLTGHQSPGAIVRDQFDWLMCVNDTSSWRDEKMLELHAVERVKQHLGICQRLLEPPIARINSEESEGGSPLAIKGYAIPATLFPSWMICTVCNSLHYKPWSPDHFDPTNTYWCKHPDCQGPSKGHSKARLVQITWCAISSTGALIDVPWNFLCHKSPHPCQHSREHLDSTKTPHLKIIMNNKGEPQIKCKCEAAYDLNQAIFEFSFKHPGRFIKDTNTEKCKYTIMEINDPRVHVSMRQRALVIPPESNISKQSLEYKLQQDSQTVARIRNANTPLKQKSAMRNACRKYNCNPEQLNAALQRIDNMQTINIEQVSTAHMHCDEYAALCHPDPDMHADADFVTRDLTNEWRKLTQSSTFSEQLQLIGTLIERLIVVDRLRVIEVFKGFRRMGGDFDELEPKPLIAPDLRGELDWLPAIELFGEGVFFTLNIAMLKKWEQQPRVKERADKIAVNYDPDKVLLPDDVAPTPRFILLHTFSHIIMRELEATAGYPAASLQERIYCDENDMAGILIYTAVPDIAGSLGGIILQAQAPKFIRILDAALRRSAWCSSDPVCAESEGQGPSLLNLAACHGCALVPDTACEYGNVLLDRILLKGNDTIPALIDIR